MTTPFEQSAADIKRRLHYYNRPLEFFRDRLGIDPWTLQWSTAGQAHPHLLTDQFGGIDPYEGHEWHGDVNPLSRGVLAVAQGSRKTVIYGGTGTAKTYNAGAATAIWFLYTRCPSIVAGFAPVLKQLKKSFLREVLKLIRDSAALPNGGVPAIMPKLELVDNTLYVDRAGHGDDWSLFIRAATVVEGEDSATVTQGLHHENLLLFLEEFPGIKEAVKNALFKTVTGAKNQIVVVGNPKGQGDALQQLVETKGVVSFHASALDHPNVVLGQELIPGCSTREFIADMEEEAAQAMGSVDKIGDYPHYRVSVLGLWPEMRENTFLGPGLLMPAKPYLYDGPPAFTFHPDTSYGTQRLPMEGECHLFTEPEGGWRNRYICYTDLARTSEITAQTAGKNNHRDWHYAIVLDAYTEHVVASLRTRGPTRLHLLACLWLCDHYSPRVPRNDAEQQRGHDLKQRGENPETAYTARAWCRFGWERNMEGGMAKNTMFEEHEVKWWPQGAVPWTVVRLYPNLHTDLNDATARLHVGQVLGTEVQGKSKEEMLDELLRWGTQIPHDPGRVADPVLFDELGTFVRKDPKTPGGREKVEAADGAHDDGVLGLAGALYVRHQMAVAGVVPKAIAFRQKAEDPLAWIEERVKQKRQRRGVGYSGSGLGFTSSLS